MIKEIIDQQELNDIVTDTNIDGGFTILYEQLEEALSQFSERRIQDMISTLKFVGEIKNIDSLSKMDIIYQYSLLI